MSARKPVGGRKAAIVRTALRLAFEVGPDAVSTGMIARELGQSQPSIYKRFPSKKHIWSAVVADLTQRIRGVMAAFHTVLTGHVRAAQEQGIFAPSSTPTPPRR